jgi:hypothetical protein
MKHLHFMQTTPPCPARNEGRGDKPFRNTLLGVESCQGRIRLMASIPSRPLMSYNFDFDSTNRILRCRFEGRVTDEELTNYLLTVWRYDALTGPRGGITDLSAVTSFEITRERLRTLASWSPVVPPLGRPRVVLATSDYIFEMARFFAVEAEITRPKLHAVRTWNEAGAILSVQEFHFEPIQTDGKPFQVETSYQNVTPAPRTPAQRSWRLWGRVTGRDETSARHEDDPAALRKHRGGRFGGWWRSVRNAIENLRPVVYAPRHAYRSKTPRAS